MTWRNGIGMGIPSNNAIYVAVIYLHTEILLCPRTVLYPPRSKVQGTCLEARRLSGTLLVYEELRFSSTILTSLETVNTVSEPISELILLSNAPAYQRSVLAIEILSLPYSARQLLLPRKATPKACAAVLFGFLTL